MLPAVTATTSSDQGAGAPTLGRIGLIGGMAWSSTALYYQVMNELTAARLGAMHSLPMIVNSVDFQRIQQLQYVDDVQGEKAVMVAAAKDIERAGSDLLMICSNTMHRMADAVQDAVGIPLLHICDAVASALDPDVETIGLLGTPITMEQSFYVDRLSRASGAAVLRPGEPQRQALKRAIYSELSANLVTQQTIRVVEDACSSLLNRGAECIVLACTSLGLVLDEIDVPVPVHDSLREHARAGVDRIINSAIADA